MSGVDYGNVEATFRARRTHEVINSAWRFRLKLST